MTEYMQRDAIKAIASLLEDTDHDVLYIDRPGSCRGGTGDHGRVNAVLEEEYDRFPDIVSVTPEDTILFVEVDRYFGEKFVGKFQEYEESAPGFLKSLNESIDKRIEAHPDSLVFGFGTFLTSEPRVNVEYDEFRVFRMEEQTGNAIRIMVEDRTLSEFTS